MNTDISQPITVPGDDEIRAILVKRVDQQKQAPGIVVGVIEPGGRHVAAHGKFANGDPRAVDGDTIFEIGSISKVFTSMVLADMVSHKEVALADPAAKYVPEYVRMPERSGKPITLFNLATHRSGLPFLPGNLKMNLTRDQTIDAIDPYAFYGVDDLYQFLSSYTLARDPGSEFEYSNLGAGLLGHLLAYRAGTSYENLIRIRITGPLRMPETGITLTPAMRQRMAPGHKATLAPVSSKDWGPDHGLAGAGALRSSVNDMLTFVEAFLGYKETPLSPAMKAMLEVRRPAGRIEIGLGWLISSSDGREIAWHNGGTGGFRSFVGFDLARRIGVVVLCNASTPGGVDDIGFHVLNPNLPLANPEPPKQRPKTHIDPELFDNYIGRYQVTPNLVLEISRDGGRLFAQGFAQTAGQAIVLPQFEVFAESERKFFARVSDNQITFEVGLDGRATGLILHRAGRDMPATRLP